MILGGVRIEGFLTIPVAHGGCTARCGWARATTVCHCVGYGQTPLSFNPWLCRGRAGRDQRDGPRRACTRQVSTGAGRPQTYQVVPGLCFPIKTKQKISKIWMKQVKANLSVSRSKLCTRNGNQWLSTVYILQYCNIHNLFPLARPSFRRSIHIYLLL